MTSDTNFWGRKKNRVSGAPRVKKAPWFKRLLNKSGLLKKLFNKSGSNPAENETDRLGSHEGRAISQIRIDEPEVRPQRNAVDEDRGCMKQNVTDGARVQDIAVLNGARVEGTQGQYGGVHHQIVPHFNVSQRQQQIENIGADRVLIRIEGGLVGGVRVPNTIVQLNLGAGNLERVYSLLFEGGLSIPLSNFMNLSLQGNIQQNVTDGARVQGTQGQDAGVHHQIVPHFNVSQRQQQIENIGADRVLIRIEGGVLGGVRVPNMIVQLNLGAGNLERVYSLLFEGGLSIPLSDFMNLLLQGNIQRFMQQLYHVNQRQQQNHTVARGHGDLPQQIVLHINEEEEVLHNEGVIGGTRTPRMICVSLNRGVVHFEPACTWLYEREIDEPEVMPHRNAVNEDRGCMEQEVGNGVRVQDIVVFSGAHVQDSQVQYGGVHYQMMSHFNVSQRQQQIENNGADQEVIHIEEGVVGGVTVPGMIVQPNLGAENLERTYSLFFEGGLSMLLSNFMNLLQGNSQRFIQQLYHVNQRQQQNHDVAQGHGHLHQQIVLNINEEEGVHNEGVIGGNRIRRTGTPRMIYVSLNRGAGHFEPTCTWLYERGRLILFNANRHSWHENDQPVICFEEGGVPPFFEQVPPMLAPLNEPVPPMQAAGFHTKAHPYIEQGIITLALYYLLGTLLFLLLFYSGGIKTEYRSYMDPAYFIMVVMSSTGYGDIYAITAHARLWTCLLIIVGCGIVAGRLSAMLNCLGNDLGNLAFGYISEHSGQPISESSKAKWKVGFAILVFALSVIVGLLGCRYVEGMGWVESLYLSIVTVTSVGFGDLHFKSWQGKLFAIFWIPLSTSLVGLSFGYLAQCGYRSLLST